MHRAIALLLASFLVLGSAQVRAPELARRVIIDTDAGTDDLLALLLLLGRTDIEIEAVTVVNGLAEVQHGARTVRRLLARFGREAIPVFPGPPAPMAGHAVFPSEWRSAANRLLNNGYPDLPQAEPTRSAVSYLARRLLVGPPVDVLALGPLTNLAFALRQEPRLGRGVRRLTWMGGAIRAPGNVPSAPHAEWNAHVDPVAVERVLSAGWNVLVVPLDATSQVPIDIGLLEQMEAMRLNRTMMLAVDLLRREAASIERGEYFAWDPLAAAVLFDPLLVVRENRCLDIRKRMPERGRLLTIPGMRPNAAVAMTADAERFRQLFLSSLLNSPF